MIELGWQTFGAAHESGEVRRYRPTKPPKWGAIATHHIFMSELEGLPESTRAARDLPPAEYWIGHNIDFDWKALGCPPVKRICTLALARELWPEVDSHSLVALTYFTKGAHVATRERVRNAHSALEDVWLCAELLRTIMYVAKIDGLPALYAASEEARIPKIMTFGKHKGKRVDEVDRGYANWYRRQEDTDPYLLEAFRRAGL